MTYYSFNCPLCFKQLSSRSSNRTPRQHSLYLKQSITKHASLPIHEEICGETYSCRNLDCHKQFSKFQLGENFIKTVLLHSHQVNKKCFQFHNKLSTSFQHFEERHPETITPRKSNVRIWSTFSTHSPCCTRTSKFNGTLSNAQLTTPSSIKQSLMSDPYHCEASTSVTQVFSLWIQDMCNLSFLELDG
jgi:hypothetical protein